jgi:hypothetical protein
LKGSGPTEFHLGCDFVRDEHGRLGYAPSSTSKDGSQLRAYLWTETVKSAVKVITQNLTVQSCSITKTPRSTSR